VSKPDRYLSRAEFDEFMTAVRALRGRRVGDYRWEVSEEELAAVSPEEFNWAVETLKRLGVDTSGLEELRVSAGRGRVAFDGAYALLYLPKPLLERLEREVLKRPQEQGGFTIVRKRFNPSTRRYEDDSRPVYRIRNGVLVVPRGALPRLFPHLPQELAAGIRYTFNGRPVVGDLSKVTVPLRDYQRQVVESALRQIEKVGAATVQMATGGGKTEVGIALAQALLDPSAADKHKLFVVVPTRDLANQWIERFRKYGVEVGRAFEGDFDLNWPIVVVTSATAYKAVAEHLGEKGEVRGGEEEEGEEEEAERLTKRQYEELARYIKDAYMVIFDEAHHVPARTVTAVAKAAGPAVKVGLSATPWRNDKLDLLVYGYSGEIVEPRITSSYLIERGYLVPVTIFVARRRGEAGENYAEEKALNINDERRAALLAELLKALPKPWLILTAEKRPGQLLLKALRERGYKVAFVHGELTGQQRKAILDALRRGELDGAIATTLADEGLDLPELNTLVLYAPGKSSVKMFQRIGRVTRPSRGKRRGYVLDIYDEETEYLEDHAKARLQMYSQEPAWTVVDLGRCDADPQRCATAIADAIRREEVAVRETPPKREERPPPTEPVVEVVGSVEKLAAAEALLSLKPGVYPMAYVVEHVKRRVKSRGLDITASKVRQVVDYLWKARVLAYDPRRDVVTIPQGATDRVKIRRRMPA